MIDIGTTIVIFGEPDLDLPDGFESACLDAAVGIYQDKLVRGVETWSGAGLRGKARQWSGGYARSRDNLLGRLSKIGKRYGLRVVSELVLNENRRYQRVLTVRPL